MSSFRTVILSILLLVGLALPRTALAHDANIGKIAVALTGQVTGSYEVMLHADATPGIPAATLELSWTLLNGGELLDGPAVTLWENPIAQELRSQERRVRTPGAGVYPVAVSATLALGEAMRFVDTAILFLVVDEDGGVAISKRDPNAASPMGSVIIDETSTAQGAIPAIPASPDADPCFNVRGVFNRIERTPTRLGYAADTLVPVRWTQIEMREEDTFFDDSYGETITDAQGRFSFSFCDDDGLFDDELELYVRMTAAIQSPQGVAIVEVQEDGFIPPEAVYTFVTPVFSSEGGTYDKSYRLTLEQSGIMNMADAVLDAWNFWNSNGGAVDNDAVFDELAEINWEAGDDLDGSYYNGYIWDHINIADGPADPDEWDDSVIMHEWNHMADDTYGCDDTPGGEHSSRQNLSDVELAWSEGYANYYQSAVRNAMGRTDGNWYLNGDVAGQIGGWDLERMVATNGVPYPASLYTSFNEAAISAMLWDLEDTTNSVNEPGDRTGFGPAQIQQVFTHPQFIENGDLFDDTCSAWVYLTTWAQIGKTANRDVGSIIQQNIGLTLKEFTTAAASAMVASAASTAAQVVEGLRPGATLCNPEDCDTEPSAQVVEGLRPGANQRTPEDGAWWQNFTFVVDNSASMAAAGKLNAVKSVIREQVNDLAPAARGTEFNLYTFNNTSSGLQQPVARKFYEDLVVPAVNSLTTTSAPDGDCSVAALNAMMQAAGQQKGGDIWLYTDRSSTLTPSIENAKRLLNQQQVRGSFAMLGGCAATYPAKMSDVTGGEINYLGNAANGSQSTGIVPYLLTALGSGGQFIYVREDQLGSAADILRAQVGNSAGAGKWSDYVSDTFTYRWDRLEAGEYQWFPAESLGQGEGQLPGSGAMIYTLPAPFPHYGGSFASVGVSQDGSVELDPCPSPCTFPPFVRYFLDVLSSDLTWATIPIPPRAAGPGAVDEAAALTPASIGAEPACLRILDGNPATIYYGPQVCAFSANLGFEWHIISVQGYDQSWRYRAFQIWLNTKTGEIRYQYGNLNGEAADAEIGLRQRTRLIFPGQDPTSKFLVSNKDAAGAYNGMGYKFIPAPPQPTRVYTVAVDSLMEGVGFLQTGYSGRFEPMIVRDPAGNPVNCGDAARVLCLTMNNVGADRMVQYVQVNVNGVTGDWTATIDAQAGSEATFTFSALAASSIQASTTGEHALLSVGSAAIATRLGNASPGALDGNILSAWFQRPNGQRFGAPFFLYDDGAHDDGRAGDGFFGNPSVPAPGAGVAYLWVQGALSGETLVRSDPTPYIFQPLEVTFLQQNAVATGGAVTLPVRITNHDSVAQCLAGYAENAVVPADWSYQWAIPPGDDGSEQFFGVCIPAGGSLARELLVTPSQGFLDGPSLASGEVTVAFVERERGAMSASASAVIMRRRDATQISLLNPLGEAALRPNGLDTATLTLFVFDDENAPVADGTLVNLSTTRGTVAVDGASGLGITAQTRNGQVLITYTTDTRPGDATVTAELVNGASDSAVVRVRRPAAVTLDLTATPTDLSGSGISVLVATARDVWGDPVAGVSVRIGLSDDSGNQGNVEGGDGVAGVTDASGEFRATFTKAAGATGSLVVRAEALVSGAVFAEDSETLFLAALQRVFLPLMIE